MLRLSVSALWNGMARQKLIRVFPARLGADALQPIAHIWILIPVHTEFVVEEEITAGRNIRNRQPVTGEVAPAGQMGVENLPARFGAFAELLDEHRIRVRHEHAQETISRRIAGELVVVPQQPAQDLATIAVVGPAEFSELLDQVIENDARLAHAAIP